MKVQKVNKNTYKCENGEAVYATSDEVAIKVCKENRKRTVFTYMIEIKKIAYNSGDKTTEELIDDVMNIVKDMM